MIKQMLGVMASECFTDDIDLSKFAEKHALSGSVDVNEKVDFVFVDHQLNSRVHWSSDVFDYNIIG